MAVDDGRAKLTYSAPEVAAQFNGGLTPFVENDRGDVRLLQPPGQLAGVHDDSVNLQSAIAQSIGELEDARFGAAPKVA